MELPGGLDPWETEIATGVGLKVEVTVGVKVAVEVLEAVGESVVVDVGVLVFTEEVFVGLLLAVI